MPPYQVVLDTNVIVSALRSNRGTSFRLLSLVGRGRFEINLSVPVVLEYEDAAKRLLAEGPLDEADVDAVLDYLCSVAHLREVYFLWRPFLRDPRDDMVLELAVIGRCSHIVTWNLGDYRGCERFGVAAVSPRDFLQLIGERR